MKSLLLILMCLFSLVSIGQDKEKLKSNIDSIVHSIITAKTSTTTLFRIVALKKVFHYISYNYQTQNGEMARIERRFSHKEDSITQIFYLKNNKMIYAIERIVSHYGNDSIVWSGNFYFTNEKLIDFITLGHGKSETETWDPEFSLKTALYEAKRDIIRHRKTKNGG